MKEEYKVKQFLLQKMTDKWIEENPGLREDILNLSHEIVMFNIRWGTKFEATDILPILGKEDK